MFLDDIKIMGPQNIGVIAKVKMELTTAFDIVNMGLISFYLGFKVERDCQKRIIKLLQPAYIQKVFTKYHLDKTHTTNTPMKEIASRPNFSTKVTQACYLEFLQSSTKTKTETLIVF